MKSIRLLAAALLVAGCSPEPTSQGTATGRADATTSTKASASVYDSDGQSFVDGMNSAWKANGRAGAFAVDSTTEQQRGANAGGKEITACASRDVCLTVDQDRTAKLTGARISGSEEQSSEAVADNQVAFVAFLTRMEPAVDGEPLFNSLLKRVAGGAPLATGELGDSCVALTTVASKGPTLMAEHGPCPASAKDFRVHPG